MLLLKMVSWLNFQIRQESFIKSNISFRCLYQTLHNSKGSFGKVTFMVKQLHNRLELYCRSMGTNGGHHCAGRRRHSERWTVCEWRPSITPQKYRGKCSRSTNYYVVDLWIAFFNPFLTSQWYKFNWLYIAGQLFHYSKWDFSRFRLRGFLFNGTVFWTIAFWVKSGDLGTKILNWK